MSVEDGAKYSIMGWMKLQKPTGEMIEIKRLWDGQLKTIATKLASTTEIFFHNEAMLLKGSNIFIYLESSVTDSSFYIHKIQG